MSGQSDSLLVIPNIEEIVALKVNANDHRVMELFVDSIQKEVTPRTMVLVNGLVNFYEAEKAYEESKWARAGDFYRKALTSFVLISDSAKQSVIHNNIGLVCFYQAFYDDALKAFSNSLEIDLLSGNTFGAAQCYQNMGLVLETNGEIDRGISMYLKALEVYEELQSLDEMASLYNNLAACYARSNRLENAEKYYLMALDIIHTQSDAKKESRILYNVGSLLIRLKRYDEGKDYIEKAMVLFKSNNDKVGEINAYSLLGDLYKEQKDYFQALFMYQLSDKQSDNLNYRDMKLSNLFAIYSTYKLLGDWDNALMTFEKYVVLKDSMRVDNHLFDSGIMDQQTEQKLLDRDLALAKNQRRAHLYSGVITVLFLFVILMSVWTLQSNRRVKKIVGNYRLQEGLLRERLDPDFYLPLVIGSDEETPEVSKQRELLVKQMLDLSVKPNVVLKQEMDLVRAFCDVRGAGKIGLNINLQMETNLEGRIDSTIVPAMFCLKFLSAVFKNNIAHSDHPLNINVGFIQNNNIVEVIFEDTGVFFSEDERIDLKQYYQDVVRGSYIETFDFRTRRERMRSVAGTLVEDRICLGERCGNRIRFKLPFIIV
jgi:tetratricopeptide (TPR) repeat protein